MLLSAEPQRAHHSFPTRRSSDLGKADAEGKHKKQSGGHGQFGVCRIKMEPIERGKGIEFDAAHAKLAVPSDRKSTRLNSSHRCNSYAVFCLKKKKRNTGLRYRY